jgi:large subunit ribosomal protein L10
MRPEKSQLASFVTDIIKDSSFLYFVSYKGLDVMQFSGLRVQIADAGSGCHVIKNTILKLGLNNAKIDIPNGFKFTGDTAIIFGDGDPGATAKVISNFSKKVDLLSFKASVIDGVLLSSTETEAFADLPSKEVLQAQLIGVLQAPMRNLAGVLNAKVASILYVLKSYLDKKEKSS